ncbi:MAG: methionine synthase [Thermoplasmatota archaeon]
MKLDNDLITTVVGSYPSKPSRSELADSFLTHQDPYKKSLEKAVQAQLDAGVEIVSDGQTRNGMIELFVQNLRGFRIKEKFEIINEIDYKGPITVEDQLFVRDILPENTMLKGIITGPWTLVKSCDNKFYDDDLEAAWDAAEALKEEAQVLADVCDMIQLDEPLFSVDYPEQAKELVETVLDIDRPTALHACGDVSDIAHELVEFDIDILDHEFAENPGLYDIYSELEFDQRLAVGVVTTKTPVEDVGKIQERIEKAVDIFGPKTMIDPDCGLRNLPEKAAFDKLNSMVKARDVVLDERS